MEPSRLFNGAVRVKEEPSDALLIGNESEMINEKYDRKNVQLLPFSRNNSIPTLEQCEYDQEGELDDEEEIVVECKDVKPNINLLPVKKIDNDFQNHYQNIKNSSGYEIQNIIKKEIAGGVNKQEIFDVYAEQLNSNFNCKQIKQSKKRRITKKFNNVYNLKTNIDAMHNDTTHACELCRKNFSTKGSLDRHVKSLHDCITYPCGNSFSIQRSLQIHVDAVHTDITHACHICRKKFASKNYLKIHVDIHNGLTHSCDLCGKSFTQKGNLKIHIDSVHNGVIHGCDICGKTYTQKRYLKKHIDSVHNGVTHACDTCGKKFTRKDNLKVHIDKLHN